MHRKTTLFAFLLASSVVVPLASMSPVSAADTALKDAVATASEAAADREIIQTVDEAYRALREIRAARLAIFNGAPDQAVNFATEAATNLEQLQTVAESFAVETAKSDNGRADVYVPFDASLALSEGFVPTHEKQETLKAANGHLAKGDHKKAVETLRLANIDVTVSAMLIPVKASLHHVQVAAKLIGEKKFYQANLALKAVEDAIIVESYSVDEIPKQGAPDNG